MLTGVDPLIIKWHIFLVDNQTTNTFLAVPRTKLVAQLGPPRLPNEDLDQGLFIFSVGNHHFVDAPRNGTLVSQG